LGPLGCLLLGIVLLVVLLLYFRFHPFLALVLTAAACALMSERIPAAEALSIVAEGFAAVMKQIGILLVLAAIIGKCLVDSGAADRIIRTFSRWLGEEREPLALLASGFLLSIPVFFDTVFYLLAPLVWASYARRRRGYAWMICAAGIGAAATHALVPPTPGPVVVAEILGVPLLTMILIGGVLALVPALVAGLGYGWWIDRRLNLEPGEVLGMDTKSLAKTALLAEKDLPGFLVSLTPILGPVLLISAGTVGALVWPGEETPRQLWALLQDKNLSFLLGAAAAVSLAACRPGKGVREVVSGLEDAVASGAVIAFITCGGGAFGYVLTQTGVGEVVTQAAKGWGIPLLWLAFLTAAMIRVVQGSATVAMITAAGIIAPALAASPPEIHPVYLAAAIGFGGTTTSWMNDSGFWLVGKLMGLDTSATLKVWTMGETVLAVSGFLWCWLLASLFPLV